MERPPGYSPLQNLFNLERDPFECKWFPEPVKRKGNDSRDEPKKEAQEPVDASAKGEEEQEPVDASAKGEEEQKTADASAKGEEEQKTADASAKGEEEQKTADASGSVPSLREQKEILNEIRPVKRWWHPDLKEPDWEANFNLPKIEPATVDITKLSTISDAGNSSSDSKDGTSSNSGGEQKEGPAQQAPQKKVYQIMNLNNVKATDNTTSQEEDVEMVTEAWFH